MASSSLYNNDINSDFFTILHKVSQQHLSQNIALSGGLDSSVLGYCIKNRKPNAYVVIADDFAASDFTYSQMIASYLDISLHMIKASTKKIVSAVDKTIKILGNFNDIEIRNSVVMYLILAEIKAGGGTSIITGDGADELFAGYDFLVKKPKIEMIEDLDRISKIMHFPSHKIAKSLSIRVQSPFLDVKIREFVKKRCKVKDLVGTHNNEIFGKWIIRKSFEGKIPSQIIWRKKVPMQDGAGTTGLSNLFNTLITDSEFKKKVQYIKQKDRVNIRTKESLYYYETFTKHFDLHNNEKLDTLTQTLPNTTHTKQNQRCPDCKQFITQYSKFCRMCGLYPI